MLPRSFLRWMLLFVGLWCLQTAKAGRNDGVNVSYECLGDGSYRITVNLFRDCAEFSDTPDYIAVHISSSCATLGYVNFYLQYSQEVSQLCPDALPNSSCSGGVLPGVDLSVYSGIVELEPCTDWKFIVAEQNRAIVTNLDDPGMDSRIHIETLLNNADGTCNSSPELGILNLPFICLDEPFYYNLGFEEPDGDSLTYALVPALTSGADGIPYEMNYNPGYSGAYPIDAISINPSTGQINITPNLVGKYTVVVRVREYRNGQMVGEVFHDFNVFVNPCSEPPPGPVAGSLSHVSGGGYPLSNDVIGICPGDAFCFEVDFSSSGPGVSLTLSSDITDIVPGATETVTGTNPATIRFCGTAPENIANQSFLITVLDDVCEISGQAYYAIEFLARKPIDAGPDTTTCAGVPVQLSAANDTAYTWYDTAGNILQAPSDISCNPCRQPTVAPDTTTAYIVKGLYEQSTCSATDTIVVNVPLGLMVDMVPETCYKNDGIIDVHVLSGSGDYEFVWDDIGVGPPLRENLSGGTYSVTIEDLVYGCSKTRTFDLDHLILPETDAGSDSLSCGLSLDLNAIPSFGDRLWTSPDGVTFDDPTAFDATATAPSEGDFTLIWTEDDGDGCMNSDTLSVSFYLAPQADISAPDSICGTEVEIEATVENGGYSWAVSPDLFLSDPGLTPTASSTGYGDRWAVIEVVNGPCLATDTAAMRFIPQPVADAGADVSVCGDTAALQPNPSVGTGSWILPTELTVVSVGPSGQVEITAGEYGDYEVVRTENAEGYCHSSDTAHVRFTEQPYLNLPSDTLVCNDSLVLDVQSVAGTIDWVVGDGYSITLDETGEATVTGPVGATHVIVSADNGYGCTAVDTVFVTFFEPPQIAISVPDTICGLSTAVSVLGDAETYAWTSTGLDFADSTLASTEATAPAPGDYDLMLIGTNPGGCIDSAIGVITFIENPYPDAAADTAVCGLTYFVEGGASVGSFSWIMDGGLSAENPEAPSTLITADQYGLFTLVAEQTNEGCTARDTAWVRFDAPPGISQPQWTCTGTDAEFVLQFIATGGEPSTWTVTGVDGSFSDSLFVSLPMPSESPVDALFSNGGVCAPDTIVGTQFCEVLTDAGAMDMDTLRVCGSDTAFATVGTGPTLDGNDSLRYALHDGPGTSLGNVLAWNDVPQFTATQDVQVGEVYYISAVAGNYGQDGIDLNHAQVSVSQGQPVVFYAVPEVFIDFSFTVCPNDTVEVPVAMTGGFPQTFTYSMAGESHTVQYGLSLVYILVSDSGTFLPISTSTEYCEGLVWGSGQVHYRSTPHIEAEMPAYICEGDMASMNLEISGDGPVSFSLLKDGMEYGNYTATGDTSLAFSEPGQYVIHDIWDSFCPSGDSIALDLVVEPLPEVYAGENQMLCTGDTAILGMLPQSGVIYSWGSASGILYPNASQSLFSAINAGYYPQTHELVLTASSAFCTDRDTVLVEVYPQPQLQLIAPHQACAGETVGLVGYGAISYAWSPQGLFNDPLSANPSMVAMSTTDYALIGWNVAGCADTLTGHIEVLPRPASGFSISSDQGCAPLDVTMQVDDPFPGATYRWKTGLRTVEETEGLVFETYAKKGTYPLSLEATSPQGCVSDTSFHRTVEVHEVKAGFDYSPKHPSVTDRTVYFTNTSTGGEQWTWTVDSSHTSSQGNFRFSFPEVEGGSYTVCLDAKGGPGCRDRICRTVEIAGEPFLYVPNAFTPNGDGLNDLFYPETTFLNGRNYRFWVVNRKGQTVFETTDIDGKWNGTERQSGYLAPPDIYIWNIVVDTEGGPERRHFTGRVMLVR